MTESTIQQYTPAGEVLTIETGGLIIAQIAHDTIGKDPTLQTKLVGHVIGYADALIATHAALDPQGAYKAAAEMIQTVLGQQTIGEIYQHSGPVVDELKAFVGRNAAMESILVRKQAEIMQI